MLFDPRLNNQVNRVGDLNGSTASLGVLMGNTFRRSKGRAWELRKRSIKIWPLWASQLSTKQNPLKINTPLISLAASKEEAESMQRICLERKHRGLQIIEKNSDLNLGCEWPVTSFGGLIAYNDGRIDPIQLQQCLRISIQELGIKQIGENVVFIERKSVKNSFRWMISLEGGEHYSFDTLVICTALNSNQLLKSKGYDFPLEPVLGQVIDLEINHDDYQWSRWPGVLIIHGTNLIPYKHNRLLMGATLEPGNNPSEYSLKAMQSLKGNSPMWLQKAILKNKWYGLRSKPMNRSAPILEVLEPGLILATGHYRNGILLAPATAEWVARQLI